MHEAGSSLKPSVNLQADLSLPKEKEMGKFKLFATLSSLALCLALLAACAPTLEPPQLKKEKGHKLS